ncbi:TonB-dependent receptor [Novosphingobium sp. 9U]|nr:TonB-dependent receptor [Novosphingobium sp. 9U]
MKYSKIRLLTATAFSLGAWTQGSHAQETLPQTTDLDNQIVVTGSRGKPRTVADSAVPIDVIPQAEIEAISFTDTQDVIKTLVPSYAVGRNPNSDGGTFVRPATLRGLPGDKTLLLVNSKRRHKSAVMTTGGAGSQAADAATIPSLALKSVEVLRDGAAAQYGSDAIAGVINFLLKDADHGGSLVVQGGQYYKGDGEDLMVSGNVGMKLTSSGFLNATVEYTRNARTTRSNQFCNVSFCVVPYAAANPSYAALIDIDDPVQRWGQPKGQAIRGFVNAGIDLDDGSRIYAFGNYSRSKSTGDFHYRYPAAGQVVNDNPIRLQDGSVFRFNQLFPAGFTPQFSGKVTDLSVAGGYRGELGGSDGLSFDLSGRYGKSRIDYSLSNTVNASIGPDSPRKFSPGSLVSDELSANADFSYAPETSFLAEQLTLSFGGEFRREGYKIIAGDPASYAAGQFAKQDPFDFCTDTHTLRASAPQNAGINCANYLSSTADGFAGLDPAYNVLAVGSNGFPGLSPTAAGSFHRNSYSFYGEASTDIVKGWFVDGAVRYEHFADFGSTANVKAATRIEVADGVALRGSIGTGFRAPTPGQLYYTSVSVRNVDGNITQAGLFPATNPVSEYLGATPLKPEKSTNFSAGFTLSVLQGFSLTADAYLIKIRDQVYSTSAITVTPAIRDRMIAAGVVGAESISSVNFFQNAFDSTTKGFDVVGTYKQKWGNGQSTSLTASFNLNRYKIDDLKIPNLFNSVSVFNFEKFQPRWRSVISLVHEIGPFEALVRGNLYGPYKAQINTAPAFPIQSFGTEALIDVEVSYTFAEKLRLSVGARNVFDNYPDRDKIGQAVNGAIYRSDSVVDWQGGFYYARAGFSF